MTFYQVVAECAHVTVEGPLGRSVQLLYKGAIVPAEAPQLKRLIELGFVAEVGKAEAGGVNADGIPAGAFTTEVPAGATSTPVVKSDEQVKSDAEAAELAEKRAAAKAKLPQDGSAPDGRAAKDVLVEYLAGNGYDYAEVAKVQDKGELLDLAKKVEQNRK